MPWQSRNGLDHHVQIWTARMSPRLREASDHPRRRAVARWIREDARKRTGNGACPDERSEPERRCP